MKTIPLNASDGQPILEYVTDVTGSGLATTHAGFIHPLFTPAGKIVTELAPADHPHHRGVFLAWYAMHGAVDADFWGWGAHAPVAGRRIVNRSAARCADGLTVHNDWLAEAAVVLQENTRITARVEAATFIVGLHYRLTPACDLRLARSAFGGFCIRLNAAGPIEFLTETGPVALPEPHYLTPESAWPDARWYAAHLGDCGVVVLNHPGNPPAGWFNNATLRMLNPCVTAPGELRWAADQTCDLRYRLVAYDGPCPTARIPSLAGAWS